MASTSKRKKHPGVVLIKPDESSRAGWRARYTDPDTGRVVKKTLPEASQPSDELRRMWAASKSKELRKRVQALADGAPRATGGSLKAAVDKFFVGHSGLRATTIAMYRRTADKLVEWATDEGIKSADDLTRPRLLEYRAVIVNETRHVHAKGTPRNEVKDTGEPRSGHTINGDLRKLGTILRYVCDLDLLPRLTQDDIRRALKKVTATTERGEFLKPAECQQLLDAALRHDAVMFKVTREENAGLRDLGTTQRYEPIAPFVAYMLLTGCRIGEAIGLPWKQVDLEAVDNEGRAVGEIHLRGSNTKTRRARTIDLSVSPLLHELLAAMHEAAGGVGRVFELSRPTAEAAADRMRTEYGAPASFTWQALRRTCGTFLTNAPAIFGAASIHRSSRQLGHSTQVAERHYLGTYRGIPRDARTVEAAMQIEGQVARILVAARREVREKGNLHPSSESEDGARAASA